MARLQPLGQVGVQRGRDGQLSSESAGMSNSEALPESATPSPAEHMREVSNSPPHKKRKAAEIASDESWERALKKNATQANHNKQFTVPQAETGGDSPFTPDVDLVTKMADFSFSQMTEIAQRLRLRKQRQTVELAMHFFWRFYMGYTDPADSSVSNMAHSPDIYRRRVMMCSCLFLAGKIRDSAIVLKDLVYLAFGEVPLSAADMSRRQQIAKAELYLIVVLGFDFNRKLPSIAFVAEMEQLTKLTVDKFLGRMDGLPWAVPAYKSFCELSKTVLCVKYAPEELAAAMIKICSGWVNAPWCLPDGTTIDVDMRKWEDRLKKAKPWLRIDDAVAELLDHLPRINISQHAFLELSQQERNRCFERRRSLNSSAHSPTPALLPQVPPAA